MLKKRLTNTPKKCFYRQGEESKVAAVLIVKESDATHNSRFKASVNIIASRYGSITTITKQWRKYFHVAKAQQSFAFQLSEI